MTGRILVTPRSLTAHGLAEVAALEPLRAAGFTLVSGPPGAAPTPADLRRVPADIVGWLAGVERIDAATLDLFPRLRVISRNGAGDDAIDLEAAARRGIEVRRAAGANAQGVAELALAHLLAGLRGTVASHEGLRRGRWVRRPGRELPDLTIGVVGFGAIGRRVAAMVRALGARTIATDPFAAADPAVAMLDLDTLLRRSDAVSLHAPSPAGAAPLLDAARLALLPRGAVVVNTARWSLVDADAMLAALTAGDVSTYAVDAFAQEPPAAHPLFAHPDVVLSAHLGGFTDASVRRATAAAVTGLLDTLGDGGPPASPTG